MGEVIYLAGGPDQHEHRNTLRGELSAEVASMYRRRAADALREYDRRKRLGHHLSQANFYAEMAGVLSESVRGWLDATRPKPLSGGPDD